MTVIRESTSASTIQKTLVMRSEIGGTPAIGCGGELLFEQEVRRAVVKGVCALSSLMADVSGGSEKAHMLFRTMTNGLLSERMRLSDNLTLYDGIMQSPAHACTTLDKYDGVGALLIGSLANTNSVELGSTTKNTTVKGLLTVDEAAEMKSSLVVQGATTMNGDMIYNKGYFEFYSDGNVITTTALLAGVPQRINIGGLIGSQVAHFTADESVNVGRIEYGGNRIRKVHAGVTISFLCEQKDKEMTFYIAKSTNSGATWDPVAGSFINMYFDKNNKYQSSAIHKILQADTGDMFEVWAVCSTNPTLNVSAINFFGLALPNVV